MSGAPRLVFWTADQHSLTLLKKMAQITGRNWADYGWFNKQEFLILNYIAEEQSRYADNLSSLTSCSNTLLLTVLRGACRLEQIDCLMSTLCDELRFYVF